MPHPAWWPATRSWPPSARSGPITQPGGDCQKRCSETAVLRSSGVAVRHSSRGDHLSAGPAPVSGDPDIHAASMSADGAG